VAGASDPGRCEEALYGDIARSYSFGRVADSTSKSYSRSWRMWSAWRERIEKGNFIDPGLEEVEVAEELASFIGFCTDNLGNKESTVGGKLVGVSFYHQQYKGMKLPLGSPYLRGVMQGIRRKQAESGVEQRIRRPLTWGMIMEMQRDVGAEGEEGRVLWIGLALTYLLMLRSEELFDRGGCE